MLELEPLRELEPARCQSQHQRQPHGTPYAGAPPGRPQSPRRVSPDLAAARQVPRRARESRGRRDRCQGRSHSPQTHSVVAVTLVLWHTTVVAATVDTGAAGVIVVRVAGVARGMGRSWSRSSQNRQRSCHWSCDWSCICGRNQGWHSKSLEGAVGVRAACAFHVQPADSDARRGAEPFLLRLLWEDLGRSRRKQNRLGLGPRSGCAGAESSWRWSSGRCRCS